MILFSKYHGCGNNFVIIKEAELSGKVTPDDYPQLALKVFVRCQYMYRG